MRSHAMRMVTARPAAAGSMMPRIPAMIMSTLRTMDQVVAEWAYPRAGLVIDVLLFDPWRCAHAACGAKHSRPQQLGPRGVVHLGRPESLMLLTVLRWLITIVVLV